jgi:hypothetical protein
VPAIARKIDHILLRVDDARAAFALFTGPLALPVAWPPFSYLGFLSAAVSFGEVNLEFLEPTDPGNTFRTLPGTRLIGLAFEPWSIQDAVAGLDRCSIGHSEPWHYEHRIPDGGVVASWTSLDIEGWPGLPVGLFVKYDRDQDERWRAATTQLWAIAGGPAGITGVAEIRLPDGGRPEFWKSIGPDPGDRVPFPGPALHVGADPEFSTALVIEVHDVEAAVRAFAAARCEATREPAAGITLGTPQTVRIELRGPRARTS